MAYKQKGWSAFTKDEKLMNEWAKLGRKEAAKSGDYTPQTVQPVKEAHPQSLKPKKETFETGAKKDTRKILNATGKLANEFIGEKYGKPGKRFPKRKEDSPMKKMDPPETQAKIKKMILSGLDKGKSDKEIMKKINSMASGDIEYTYNRDLKKVKTRKMKTGGMGFEGESETDPDKG